MSTLHQLAIGLSVSEKTLQAWNKSFKLTPTQNVEGHLVYSAPQKALLLQIHHLIKERGFTVVGAKKELKKEPLQEKKKETIQKLQHIRVFLEELKDSI
jgi:DNA-binding transcriptional MerR regulator